MTDALPTPPVALKAVEQRFWAKVDRTDESGCWLWTGATDSRYGQFYLNGRLVKAHRLSIEMATGKQVPADRVVCHTCDVTLCVNPAHLVVGTQSDNLRDASAKGRVRGQSMTHCERGHPFAGDNLRWRSNGQRTCKACEHMRRPYSRKAA